jgi:two-component sensor histidine kinase
MGLILSELATNAVKHGFDSELEKNFFRVSLSEKSSRYSLVVENSGHPFPEDLNIKTLSNSCAAALQSLFHIHKPVCLRLEDLYEAGSWGFFRTVDVVPSPTS